MWLDAVRAKEAATKLSIQILIFKPLGLKKILDIMEAREKP
jgi:hypothetical protein